MRSLSYPNYGEEGETKPLNTECLNSIALQTETRSSPEILDVCMPQTQTYTHTWRSDFHLAVPNKQINNVYRSVWLLKHIWTHVWSSFSPNTTASGSLQYSCRSSLLTPPCSPHWCICTSVWTPSWCNLDASHICIKSFLYLRVHRGETTLCGEAMCDIYNFSWYFFQACGNLGPFVSMRTADSTTLEKVRDACGNFSSNCANSQKLKQPWHF